jgi:hypothetical protein
MGLAISTRAGLWLGSSQTAQTHAWRKEKSPDYQNVSGLFRKEGRAGAQQISDILELSLLGRGQV